jgi:predicted enzyme related to lactoylglutathione lyase
MNIHIQRSEQDTDVIFFVDGIEELYQRLSDQSVEIVQSVRQMPYGMEFYIADPDGHMLGFVSTE